MGIVKAHENFCEIKLMLGRWQLPHLDVRDGLFAESDGQSRTSTRLIIASLQGDKCAQRPCPSLDHHYAGNLLVLNAITGVKLVCIRWYYTLILPMRLIAHIDARKAENTMSCKWVCKWMNRCKQLKTTKIYVKKTWKEKNHRRERIHNNVRGLQWVQQSDVVITSSRVFYN